VLHIDIYIYTLIGGFNPPEKYLSDWIIIPTTGENKIHVPVTTNQKFLGNFEPTFFVL